MGTLRKMGAFLGLVPDEQEAAEHRGAGRWDARERDHHGDDRYGSGQWHDGHDDYASHGDEAGYESGYDGRGETGWDGYEAGHEGWTDAAADAGADRPGLPPYTEPAYAMAGAAATAVEDAPERTRGRRREPVAADRGRGGDAARPEVDFRTQGALAVQPEVAVDTAAETAAKPATVSLTGFADAREVGELYRRGQAVILDMTELTDAEARRMVDFAAGLAFAVRGSIDKVTTKVFMLHPPSGDDARR